MKLIPNAAKVAKKAWSPRLIGLGVLIQAAELMPQVNELLPPGPLKWAGLIVMAAAGVARFVAQEEISNGK